MTSPNPFAQTAPAPAQPQQQAPAPAQAPGNPFAPATPAQPQQPAAPAYAPAAPSTGSYGAPAQPQQAPAPNYGGAPPALDMSRLASAGAPVVGEGRGAKLADMYGRLVLFFPLSIARVPRNPQYITQEQRNSGNVEQGRMTATVVVLDGGSPGDMSPIQFGGAPYALPPTPHTDSALLPYVRKGMWINQSRLISQLSASLPAGPGQAPGMIAGRVTKAGPQQNDPWYLIGASDAELALVQQYLNLVTEGRFPHPLA